MALVTFGPDRCGPRFITYGLAARIADNGTRVRVQGQCLIFWRVTIENKLIYSFYSTRTTFVIKVYRMSCMKCPETRKSKTHVTENESILQPPQSYEHCEVGGKARKADDGYCGPSTVTLFVGQPIPIVTWATEVVGQLRRVVSQEPGVVEHLRRTVRQLLVAAWHTVQLQVQQRRPCLVKCHPACCACH